MTDHIVRRERLPWRTVYQRLAILVAASCLGACGDAVNAEHANKVTAAVSASTAVVDTSTFVEMVDGTGLVSARRGYAAALAAPTPTRIVRVHVAVGDHVRGGAPLVDFEALLFDAALTSAQAALAAAEHASTRASRLVAAGIAPRRDAESASADLAAAQAAATNARRAQQLATLRAPITGVVTRVTAVLGANVDAGQTLVEIVDPSRVDVLLQFPPSVAARLRVGQTVTFKENAGESASAIGSGGVADVSAEVDSGTRTVSVRVTLDTRTRPIRIGETVFGQVITGTHVGVTVISDQALVPFEEGFRIFVVDSSNVAHARNITIGGRSGRRVWVTDGVTRGETVVTVGAYGLDDGATVVRVDAKSQAIP